RPRLRTAEPTVERNELLEGAALVELRVVEASHHDVGDVREAVRPPEVIRGTGRERRERIVALHPVVCEVARAGPAQGDRPVLRGPDEQPPDVRVLPECGDECGVALVDL